MVLFILMNYGFSDCKSPVAAKVPIDDLWTPKWGASLLSVAHQSVISSRFVIYNRGMRRLSSPVAAKARKCCRIPKRPGEVPFTDQQTN
jgi:hypothetical protein